MRELSEHKVNPANDKLAVTVMDPPGSGGANHHYRISGFSSPPPSFETIAQDASVADVVFQNGPIQEAGVNGVTHEALLAIIADRLRGFQAGPFACRDNAIALTKIEEAQMWLQKRTRERISRHVEGTNLA